LSDHRIAKYARILIDYSTRVQPGDRVGILTTTAAESLVRELLALVLDRGGHPHVILEHPEQDEIFYAHASDEQLDYLHPFYRQAFEEFEVLIKVRAETNTRALSQVDPERQGRRQKTLAPLLQAQMRRGADGSLRWMSTQFPTRAYAIEAEMGFEAYQDFFYRACHADEATPDPVAYWQGIQQIQQKLIDRIEGHDRVEICSPNAELSLSIQGRKFLNDCGINNLPDGEINTGPVENSVNGWVHYTYPAVIQGRVVEGIELTFVDGKVVSASARKNEDFLLRMLDADPGARYLGEFAIGTNFEIDRFTKNILFDEKIGGSFHTAVGAGYPETGSQNRSIIHWDMICDLRQDSEIRLDGTVLYRNGGFVA